MNSKDTITPIQRFWLLLQPDKREISNVYVYAIFNGLVNLSLPLGIQAIINLIQGGQISTAWGVLVLFVIMGVAITGVLQIFQLRITENLQQKIFTRAAFEFAFRIPRIRLEVLYHHYAPELINRFFDTLSVQKGLSKILIDFSTASLQVIFGLLLLSFYHPFFIAFSLILIILVYALFRFTAKSGLKTSLEESKHKYKVVYWLEELARTGTTFKLAGMTDLPLDRTDKHVGDYLNARDRHFKILVRQYFLMVLFKVLVATGLLAIGGLLVIEQHMNIGQFVAAEIIILLVMASVEKLVTSLETIYDVLTALEKIGQVTDMELEPSSGIDVASACPEGGIAIALSDLSFTYPDYPKKTLENLSFSIGCGDRWVITGPNGSGKSTFLQILAGLYDAQEGNIAYNNLPKGNLDPRSLRSIIGDCLSQEQIFYGTVLENLTIKRSDATFDQVRWAVENLDLADFIKSLPQGYDTLLEPEGKRLPRSIIQKLLLARSIVDKPKLLILEDTFEHIDPTERKKIIDFITSPEHGWTLVAVSSNAYLAKRCNQIAIMEGGRIAQTGNYEEMRQYTNFKTIDDA